MNAIIGIYYRTKSGCLVVAPNPPVLADGKWKIECYNVRKDGSHGGYHGRLKMQGLRQVRQSK